MINKVFKQNLSLNINMFELVSVLTLIKMFLILCTAAWALQPRLKVKRVANSASKIAQKAVYKSKKSGQKSSLDI